MKQAITFTHCDVAEALAEKFPEHFPNGPVPNTSIPPVNYPVDGKDVVGISVPVSKGMKNAFEHGAMSCSLGSSPECNPYAPGHNPLSADTTLRRMWFVGYYYQKNHMLK